MHPDEQRKLKDADENAFLRKYEFVDEEGEKLYIPVFDDEMARTIFKNFDDFNNYFASRGSNQDYEPMNGMLGVALAQDTVTGEYYVTIGTSTNGTEALKKYCERNFAALERQFKTDFPNVTLVDPRLPDPSSTTSTRMPYDAFNENNTLYDIKGNKVPNTSKTFCAATSMAHTFGGLKNGNLEIKKMAERGRFDKNQTPVTDQSKGNSGNRKQVPPPEKYHSSFHAKSCNECCKRIPKQFKK